MQKPRDYFSQFFLMCKRNCPSGQREQSRRKWNETDTSERSEKLGEKKTKITMKKEAEC